jgi:hypothetical protein
LRQRRRRSGEAGGDREEKADARGRLSSSADAFEFPDPPEWLSSGPRPGSEKSAPHEDRRNCGLCLIRSPGLAQDAPVFRSIGAAGGLFSLWIAAIASGCAEVKPWERGTLAQPAMDPTNVQRQVCQDFIRHTYDIREGSSGGAGQAGGGCGCN